MMSYMSGTSYISHTCALTAEQKLIALADYLLVRKHGKGRTYRENDHFQLPGAGWACNTRSKQVHVETLLTAC